MEPFFTSDAVVLGLLLTVLALIFYTSHLDQAGWKKFYTYVPALLLCYFIPALLHWPLGWIAAHWYDYDLIDFLQKNGHAVPDLSMSYSELEQYFKDQNLKAATDPFKHHSQLY